MKFLPKTISPEIFCPFKNLFRQLFASDKALIIICVGLSFLALFVNRNASIFALDGPHDSLRYIGMAKTIVAGDWLGDYNHMTLIRLPMYPLLLALNSMAGWRLHVLQQGIYLLSILVLVAAMRTVNIERWRVVIACTLCVFHPIPFYTANFVGSEVLYIPSATMVMAAWLGLLGSQKRPVVHYIFWLGVLTLSLAVFWYTRREGIWILPFYAMCFGFFLWRYRSNFRIFWVRIAATLLIPCAVVIFVGSYLASMNEERYGVRVTNELSEPNLVEAFRWLTRLSPESRRPYVPVTLKSMEAAYGVSPHFALLKPYLSQQTHGKGWGKYGCEWMGICDEIAGGWTIWAIRDAVASIGVYSSAVRASKFYAAIAREIRQACKNGELNCSNNPTGNFLAPPVTLTDIPRILISSARLIISSVTLGDFGGLAEGWDEFHPQPRIVERYEGVTHDQNSRLPANYGKTAAIHTKIYSLLQVSGILSLIILFSIFLFRVRSKQVMDWPDLDRQRWKIAACILMFILSRIAIIGYVDAMSFPANFRYLMVLYPPLMVLICLLLPPFKNLSKKGK